MFAEKFKRKIRDLERAKNGARTKITETKFTKMQALNEDLKERLLNAETELKTTKAKMVTEITKQSISKHAMSD